MDKKNILSKHIGILCAMPEEVGSTLENLKNIETKKYGDLKIHSGNWCFSNSSSKSLNIHLSIAWSGWGKVSAARAATRLISHQFKKIKIDAIIFTGVAGAINSKLKQWDIIIPYELIQHDMDARPLFKKYEIPALKTVKIKSNRSITNWTLSTLKNSKKNGALKIFGTIYEGFFQDGERHGKGKIIMPDGFTYSGRWVSGEIDGQGKAVYPNGDVYEGSFKKGQRDGEGRMKYANGEEYSGAWSEGEKEISQ